MVNDMHAFGPNDGHSTSVQLERAGLHDQHPAEKAISTTKRDKREGEGSIVPAPCSSRGEDWRETSSFHTLELAPLAVLGNSDSPLLVIWSLDESGPTSCTAMYRYLTAGPSSLARTCTSPPARMDKVDKDVYPSISCSHHLPHCLTDHRRCSKRLYSSHRTHSLSPQTPSLRSISMAAPRATQFIALRNLTRGAQQLRQFHTPSSASFASPTAARELNSQPRTSGTPYDHSRRTTARPNASGSVSVRRFTASSQLSAARDSSTIDFFYFPSVDRDSDDGSFIMRVPILPDNYDPPRTGAHALDTEEPVRFPCHPPIPASARGDESI